jgi:hypothetical protein
LPLKSRSRAELGFGDRELARAGVGEVFAMVRVMRGGSTRKSFGLLASPSF